MSIKRRTTSRKKRAPLRSPAEQDLDATSRALFDLEQGREPQVTDEGSVEDPLQDWPESTGEPDQWQNERRHNSDAEREK